MNLRGSTKSLATKLHVAAGFLVALIIVSTWSLYQGALQYQYHILRSAHARDVSDGYLRVSNHTFRKLNAMGEIVALGRVDDIEARFLNATALRDALSLVRAAVIAEEVLVENDEIVADDLVYLASLERLVAQIISSSRDIREAVAEGRQLDAKRHHDYLRSDAVEGKFNRLIDVALASEAREVMVTTQAAQRLGDKIAAVVPAVIAVTLITGLTAIVALSKGVTHSVSELQTAAEAYADGDFQYRIPPLAELEFSKLRDALTGMARELEAKKVLEETVAESTRDLEVSNAKLAALDRSRIRFLSDISHELRTPLTLIGGEADLALRGDVKSSLDYIGVLQRILEQAKHTSRLVDDLLFVARVEEGYARVVMRSIAIASVLRAVCDDCLSAMIEKQLTIEQAYEDERVVVSGDAGRLRQVFIILLNNAVRYSTVQGEIRVTLIRTNDSVEIRVTDNGIGLSEEEASQAFSRFYRGDNATRHAEGTGLGLPVAKAIIESHHGEIELNGKPGLGAEALVRLPVEQIIRADT